jgi:ribonuclease P/MRP protein subunit RPP1
MFALSNLPVGYTVVAHTVTSPQTSAVITSPFGTPEARLLPYQSLDPRFAPGPSSGSSQPTLVQVTRYHMRLDDGKMHPIVS